MEERTVYKDSFHILFEKLMLVDDREFSKEDVEHIENWLQGDEMFVEVMQLTDRKTIAGFVDHLKSEGVEDEDQILRVVGAISKMDPRPFAITSASDAVGSNNDTDDIKHGEILPVLMVLPMDYDDDGEGGYDEVKILNMRSFTDGMGRQFIDLIDLNDLSDEDEEGPSL